MEVLGHSQIAVTMNVYGHVMDSQLRDAADAVDEALLGRRRARRPGRRGAVTVRGLGYSVGYSTGDSPGLSWPNGPSVLLTRVELRGLEPLTPTLPVWCA